MPGNVEFYMSALSRSVTRSVAVAVNARFTTHVPDLSPHVQAAPPMVPPAVPLSLVTPSGMPATASAIQSPAPMLAASLLTPAVAGRVLPPSLFPSPRANGSPYSPSTPVAATPKRPSVVGSCADLGADFCTSTPIMRSPATPVTPASTVVNSPVTAQAHAAAVSSNGKATSARKKAQWAEGDVQGADPAGRVRLGSSRSNGCQTRGCISNGKSGRTRH